MKLIAFTKVSLPYGWLGNMAPYEIKHDGKWYRTTEALFQALRFSDPTIREAIRFEKSPMKAKMIAKARKSHLILTPGDEQDQDNMRLVLRLKVGLYPQLKQDLLATGDALLVEDCTNRGKSIWGARLVEGRWVGENLLGRLWMELRDWLREQPN